MSFEKQVLILRAYVVYSEKGLNPVHYRTVVSATRVARTQVSGVNAFFTGLGFIRRTGKGTYVPTAECVRFYSDEPGKEDYNYLREPVERSELYSRVRNFVQVHGSTTEKQIVNYLLDLSGETTPSRARRALEWLVRTNLVRIGDEGSLEMTKGDSPS